MSPWNALSAIERTCLALWLVDDPSPRLFAPEVLHFNIHNLARDVRDGNNGPDAQCQPPGSLGAQARNDFFIRVLLTLGWQREQGGMIRPTSSSWTISEVAGSKSTPVQRDRTNSSGTSSIGEAGVGYCRLEY